MNRFAALGLALALALPGALVAAKNPAHPIVLLVAGEQGEKLEGVQVKLTAGGEKPFETGGVTDAKGEFHGELADFTRAYKLTLDKKGFLHYEQTLDFGAAQLKEGMVAQVNVKLTVDRGPDPVALYNEGVKAIGANDFPGAIAKFEAAVTGKADLWQAWSVLAMLYTDAKRYDDAIGAADKALAVTPDDGRSLRARYDSLAAKKDAGADAALEALAAAAPSTETATLMFNAGVSAMTATNYELAEKRFRGAVAMDPKLSMGHVALAELRIRDKKYEEAVTELDAAIAASPRNFKAYERKIDVLKAINDPKRVKAAEEALAAAKGAP